MKQTSLLHFEEFSKRLKNVYFYASKGILGANNLNFTTKAHWT